MKKNTPSADNTLSTQVNYRLVEALSESESRFKTLIEQLNEIVFSLDLAGIITFLNPAWESHTGFSIAESLGRPIYDFIHPDDAHDHQRFKFPDESEQGKLTFELRFLHKNGKKLWFEASLKPVNNPIRGKEIFGTFIDITGHVTTLQALNTSRERFSLAATASNDGIWDWNLETDEVYFSPRWKEMLGYRDDEIEDSYASWYHLIHPDDVEKTIAELVACLEGKSDLYESVHRLKNKNGGWNWILDRGVVMRDAKGLGLRMAGSHADITRLRAVEEALLAQRQELNTIVSMSPDGIVTLTEQGLVSSVNPMFLKMTGFNLEELIMITEAEFAAKMTAISKNTYQVDDTQTCSFIQIQPLNPARTASVDDDADPLIDSTGRVLKITVCKLASDTLSKILYFRDVTIETEIDRMKSEFLSTAAHELRTPMSGVFGFTELLLTREFDKITTQKILQTIHQQAGGLVSMLNDLLDLAKIEARTGKEFNFQTYRLDDIAKQVIAEFMMYSDTHTIITEFPESIDCVNIDKDQVKRALTNIVSNAVKYSPDGGIILISIRNRHINGEQQIGVLVKDQGLGMSEEQLTHIFERFWRGHNTSKITGTGLGMSLVKEIMSLHQGTIEISSQPGIGTEVRLWFKTFHSE